MGPRSHFRRCEPDLDTHPNLKQHTAGRRPWPRQQLIQKFPGCYHWVRQKCLPRNIADVFPRQTLDRKSTRLNSSHVSISYDVFCLTKKKKTEYLTRP